MIDAHIHADCRPYEDFEKMAVAGVESAVTLAHDPLRMSTSAVVLDHLHRILENDIPRAAENGLKLKAALGIHPRSICDDYEVVFNKLPWFLEQKDVVALGEIGLESASSLEQKLFHDQLQMANEMEIKVVVHTPRRNKREITSKALPIILGNIDPSLVLVDHVDYSIIDLLINYGGMLGLTVQPQKMTPSDAVKILEEHGPENFVLDSDISSSPSDPLSVPKTVHQMKMAGFNKKEIDMVSHKNAADFYNL